MRRLALALTVGLTLPLLAGCPVSPCVEPTLEVRWELHDAAGALVTCATAQTPTVNVIVDGQQRAGIACTDGAYKYEGLAPGAHRVTVEARSAAGTVFNRDWKDVVTLAECGTTTETLKPGRGTLAIFYGMSPVNQCWAQSDPVGQEISGYMWFQVSDSVYGAWAGVTEASSAANRALYACGDFVTQPTTYRPIRFDVPFGEYTLEWIKDVKFPVAEPPVRADLYQMCTPTSITIQASGVHTINATLTPVTTTTPACP